MRTAFFIIVLLLCASCVMQLLAGDAGDKGWLLLAARMWLEGGRLYTDIVEVNPPLIVWFYAIPSWLSQRLPGLPDYEALATLGLISCALSVALSGRLIRYHPAFMKNRPRKRKFKLLLAALFVFMTGPVYFFDREHIMLVFTLPYIVRFMPGVAHAPVPARLRSLVGLMAALGFLIKPYALIPFAVLQLLYLLRERSFAILWSLENCVVYAGALLYLACIYHFTPEYVQVVFPMALATYSAFSRRLLGMFYGLLALIMAGVALADFRPRHRTPYRRDIYYFLGVSLGFLAYALANNGWGYTWHPLICIILLTTGLLYLEYGWLKEEREGRGEPARSALFGERACLISLSLFSLYMAGCMVQFFITPACDWSTDCAKNRPYLAWLQQHQITSFGALSEDFHKWPSLVKLSGARFETRYNALWMVPKLVHEDAASRAGHQWILDNVAAGLADDLSRRRPQIVFVDTSPEFFGYSFPVDLPGLFSGVPVFKEAWGRYRPVDVIDRCTAGGRGEAPALSGCRYTLYRRIP